MKITKLMAIALNLSVSLFALAYFLFYLRDENIIKDWHAVLILSLVIFQFIYYAISQKNKS